LARIKVFCDNSSDYSTRHELAGESKFR
jgi:hypothetical protein